MLRKLKRRRAKPCYWASFTPTQVQVMHLGGVACMVLVAWVFSGYQRSVLPHAIPVGRFWSEGSILLTLWVSTSSFPLTWGGGSWVAQPASCGGPWLGDRDICGTKAPLSRVLRNLAQRGKACVGVQTWPSVKVVDSIPELSWPRS